MEEREITKWLQNGGMARIQMASGLAGGSCTAPEMILYRLCTIIDLFPFEGFQLISTTS